MTDLEVVLYLWLPVGVAAAVASCSVWLAWLGRTAAQTLAAIIAIVILSAAVSGFFGWPTIWPYLAIAATLSILFGQAAAIVRAESRRSTARTADPTTTS